MSGRGGGEGAGGAEGRPVWRCSKFGACGGAEGGDDRGVGGPQKGEGRWADRRGGERGEGGGASLGFPRGEGAGARRAGGGGGRMGREERRRALHPGGGNLG